MLTHVVAPYRVPIYKVLADEFRLTLLYGGKEDVRRSWDRYAEQIGGATVKQSWGVVVRRKLRRAGEAGVFEDHYTHFTLGLFADLVRSRPHAVLSHEMGVRTMIALLYGMLTGTSVWVGWEGTRHTERAIGPTRRAVRWLISRWARRWLSYGDEATDYLESIGVRRDRILQIQNGVDETRFTTPVAPALSVEPRPVVLYTGRFVGLKGVPVLLNAAARLQREGLTFSLLLVGDGPERAAVERTVAEHGLQNVRFVHAVAPEEMPAVYRSADVLVMPTLHDVWGLVVNEALWSGLPVLASCHAGASRELLPANQVFDPADPDALVAMLRDALTNGLPKPDTSTMLPIGEIARRIVDDIHHVLGTPPRRGATPSAASARRRPTGEPVIQAPAAP